MATARPSSRRGQLRTETIRALISADVRGRLPPGAGGILENHGYAALDWSIGGLYLTPRGTAARSMLIDIAARYRAGSTALRIAAPYGISERTVLRWLRVMGVSIRGHGGRLTEEQRQEIARRYPAEPKSSLASLAHHYGVSPRGIAYTLARANVPRRPGGYPARERTP